MPIWRGHCPKYPNEVAQSMKTRFASQCSGQGLTKPWLESGYGRMEYKGRFAPVAPLVHRPC